MIFGTNCHQFECLRLFWDCGHACTICIIAFHVMIIDRLGMVREKANLLYSLHGHEIAKNKAD